VVSIGIDSILSIGKVRPNFVSKKFKLWLIGPIRKLQFMFFVFTDDFLQTDNICMSCPDGAANVMQAKFGI
jgi:hypothetical protein